MQVLNVHGLVEAEIMLEASDIGFSNVRILEVRRERSARRLTEDPIQDDRDEQQQRDVLQRAADDVRGQR
jgi:hypothetical protein